MANPSLSWDRPIKEIWEELAETANEPDAPYCRKLVLLAQLKTAEAAKRYTKWLMFLTVLIVLCTVVETFVAALTYQHSPVISESANERLLASNRFLPTIYGVIPGTFNILMRRGDDFGVTFARHDIPAGGSLRPHSVTGIKELADFLVMFDIRLTPEQVRQGQRGGFGERYINAQAFEKYSQ